MKKFYIVLLFFSVALTLSAQEERIRCSAKTEGGRYVRGLRPLRATPNSITNMCCVATQPSMAFVSNSRTKDALTERQGMSSGRLRGWDSRATNAMWPRSRAGIRKNSLTCKRRWTSV